MTWNATPTPKLRVSERNYFQYNINIFITTLNLHKLSDACAMISINLFFYYVPLINWPRYCFIDIHFLSFCHKELLGALNRSTSFSPIYSCCTMKFIFDSSHIALRKVLKLSSMRFCSVIKCREFLLIIFMFVAR